MTLGKQILVAFFLFSGILFEFYSYWRNDENFWKFFDIGEILVAISFILLSARKPIICIVAWLFLAVNINSAITSHFFDIAKFEINQKIVGWIVATAFFIAGIVYNFFKWIIEKQVLKKNELCKKDARDKYKSILDRMHNMEIKLDHKTQQIDDFLKKLTHG